MKIVFLFCSVALSSEQRSQTYSSSLTNDGAFANCLATDKSFDGIPLIHLRQQL